ncbi:hypothetical protein GGF31_000998 [Allomyces arbusculus]|nr:hypothetical protein GGF31_000998 [Allomyces arbusculus]
MTGSYARQASDPTMVSVALPLVVDEEVTIYTPKDSIDAAAARELAAFDDVDDKETVPDRLLTKDDDYLAVPDDAAGLPPPPPVVCAKDQLDRGLRAWLSVVVSFLTTFVVFGNQVSFGVYQKYYLSTDYPDAKPSTVSLIGSLGPAAQFIVGILIGRVVDRTSYRFTIAAGAVTIGVSLVLASFATQIWHLALTQGVLFGFGCSLAFFPGVSLPTQWFVERRALAVGIAIAGSGCGGIVFTAMIGALLPRLGSPWTLRICGFTSLALLGLGALLTRSRVTPQVHKGKKPLLDVSLLRDKKFLSLLFTVLCFPFGLNIPFFYLPSFVATVAHQPASFTTTLLTVTNVASIVGRIVSGYIADKVGTINMYICTVICTGVPFLALWLPAGESTGMLLAFGALFGFFSGGFFSMNTTATSVIFGVQRLPSVLGLLYAVTVIGNLAGPPIAGALVTAMTRADGVYATAAGPYLGAIAVTGSIIIIGALGILYLRFAILNRRVWVRL